MVVVRSLILIKLHEQPVSEPKLVAIALVKCREECDTIVVARLGGHNHDELRMAKPCPVCALALKEAGIDKVHYTTNDGFLYEYK